MATGNGGSNRHYYVARTGYRSYEAHCEALMDRHQCELVDAQKDLITHLDDILRRASVEVGIAYHSAEPEIDSVQGFVVMGFRDATRAHSFAECVLEEAEKDELASGLSVAIEQWITGRTFTSFRNLDALAVCAGPAEIVISQTAFAALEIETKRQYSEEQVASKPNRGPNFHRLVERSGAAGRTHGRAIGDTCFIITPYARQDDPRPAQVFELYIEPTVKEAGFQALRADRMRTMEITQEMMNAIERAPMAIAYLGRPPWNANVMIELGLRLAFRKPLVILRESIMPNEEDLPFDLRNFRVIMLPNAREEAMYGERIRSTKEEVSDSLKALGQQSDGWTYAQPLATVRYSPNEGEDRRVRYTASTPQADDLFECRLEGTTVARFVDDMSRLMEKPQFEAFSREQQQLLTAIAGILSNQIPRATVPIVVNRHRDRRFVGRKFLPIVTRYSRQGSECVMRLMYLDVSEVVQQVEDDQGRKIWVAKLS